MRTSLWFRYDVSCLDWKRLQLDIQEELTNKTIQARNWNVRATLETSPDKRPWNKAQAIFLGAMRERLLTSKGLQPVSELPLTVPLKECQRLRCHLPRLRSGPAGWWTRPARKIGAECRYGTPPYRFGGCMTQGRKFTSSHGGQFEPWLSCAINLNRENGEWCCEWLDDL